MPASARLILVAAILATALVGTPASAQPVPDGYAYSHQWFESTDGTQLHAGVFLPEDRAEDERHPVILVSTPYAAPNGGVTNASGGSLPNMTGPMVRFRELFSHPSFRDGRYAYVEVDVRGFGGSGGCFGYYLPPEAEDVKVAVEWTATQPWSTGRVGMWGKSYDSAQQVLALASDPEGLAATVIQAPGLSAYTALWMNGVHYATGRYATTGVYTADDLFPAQNQDTYDSPEYATGAASSFAADPTCRTDGLARMNVERDRDGDFWQGKEPYKEAAGSDVPTLWSHGFWDANTKPAHLDIWESLTGPKQAWFGQYTHLRGHENGVGRGQYFLDEAFRFLDRYVREIDVAQQDPAVTVQQGDNDGLWRTEEAWPPADAEPWSFDLRPGSYVDEPGNGGYATGEGHWTVTRPLPHDAHLAGEIELGLKVETLVPNVNVVAHVYDIDESGAADLVTRGAMSPGGMGEQEIAFALYPQDWLFLAGHRIAIRLSGSDDAWFSPGVSHTDVAVTGGSLTLPLLGCARQEFVDGGSSDGMRSPFSVNAATLDGGSVENEPPPAQAAPEACDPAP